MSNAEKKSCNDCAYLHYNFFGTFDDIHEFWKCRCDKSSIQKNQLKTKFCDKFILKKEGMTLEQQLEETRQKKLIEERTLFEKKKQIEYNKLSNRLKRNWKVIVELIGVIAGIATVIEVYLLLIHW